jgi:HAD superfamily hydrolase (TIGR01509 family)
MTSVDCLLFDFDGTICNSQPVHDLAFKKSLVSLGYAWDSEKEKIYEQVKTETTRYKLDTFLKLNKIKIEDIEKLNYTKQKLTLELIEIMDFDNRIFENIERHKVNKKIGLVSNATKLSILTYLKLNRVNHLFDTIVAAEDIKNLKPNPDAYNFALKQLCCDPKRSAAFEDSETGLNAAKAANIQNVIFCNYSNIVSFLEKL